MASSKLSLPNPSYNFPEELIIEVLSRLPARSLVEFAVVCKAWNLLIKSPSFISKHFKQSTKNPKLTSTLVYSHEDDENEYVMLSYSENSLNKLMSPRFPFMDETDDIAIISVSNGLICMKWYGTAGLKFHICNPVTKKFHKIPDLELLDNDRINIADTSFGFGFDPTSNDYMLITVMPYLRRDQIAIYSISTDSWRKIDTNVFWDMNITDIISPATIGGVFYWEGIKQTDKYDVGVIWSFDMRKRNEMNQVIEGPNCFEGKWYDLHPMFLELNEELAVFLSTREKRCYDVWVLNKEGTLWSEKFKIGPFPIIERPVQVQNSGEVIVAGYSRNGDLIVVDKTVSDDIKFFSYNLSSKEFRVLPFPHRAYYGYRVFWYTETLLPVNKSDQVR